MNPMKKWKGLNVLWCGHANYFDFHHSCEIINKECGLFHLKGSVTPPTLPGQYCSHLHYVGWTCETGEEEGIGPLTFPPS